MTKKNPIIVFSEIDQKDFIEITQWPQYRGVHAQMDYAIRTNGWLDYYCNNFGNYCYAAKIRGLCVGFSLLIQKGGLEAEFRIAVHPNFVGFRYGSKIMKQSLRNGFSEHKLRTITLIVRKNILIAQRLYTKHGFSLCGETTETIQGHSIDFFVMKIYRENFIKGEM